MSKATIDNVIEYYKGLPQQEDALRYALDYLFAVPGEEEKFLAMWRKSVGVVAQESTPRLLDKYSKEFWSNSANRVSRYFTVGEVTQGDSRRIPRDRTIIDNIIKLAHVLDSYRMQYGTPLGVTSWYRPVDVNREVGGASNSAHIQGYAADVYPIGGSATRFQEWVDKLHVGGVGYGAGRGFVHIDLGANRRWNY